MSYRRRNTSASGGVQGPNSALTEFLRENGINDEMIRRRQLMTSTTPESEAEAAAEAAVAAVEQGAELEDIEDEELEIRIAARRKQRRRKHEDDEYTDSENEDAENDLGFAKKTVFRPGETTECFQCQNPVTVTTFTRKHKDSEGNIDGYYCSDCTRTILESERAKRQKQLAARKKRRKVAEALLDKEEVKFPSLQDFCIKVVTKYIDQVDAFGDIGTRNLEKISRVISRNRLLNDSTVKLFVGPNVTELKFEDCAKLSGTALRGIASFAPNLTSLSLKYCGRLNNSIFDYYTDQLNNLESLELYGAFLIGDNAWVKFFKKFGPQLKRFALRYNYRFTQTALDALVEHCTSLEELYLEKLDGLLSEGAYVKVSELKTLRKLEISRPFHENLVLDADVIEICANIGVNLESLILNECTGLTDSFLINGVKPFCSSLKNLSLKQLDQITDYGVSELFTNWEINTGLLSLDFQKCVLLSTTSMIDVVNHSSHSLVELNINSLNNVEKVFFDVVREKKLPWLTTMDVGFVRCVDDSVIAILGQACPRLKILEVYGNNRCTAAAKIRSGLKVIGRQSDSI